MGQILVPEECKHAHTHTHSLWSPFWRYWARISHILWNSGCAGMASHVFTLPSVTSERRTAWNCGWNKTYLVDTACLWQVVHALIGGLDHVTLVLDHVTLVLDHVTLVLDHVTLALDHVTLVFSMKLWVCWIFLQGPMTIVVQEFDGCFTHTVQVEDSTSVHELPCHSKIRKWASYGLPPHSLLSLSPPHPSPSLFLLVLPQVKEKKSPA